MENAKNMKHPIEPICSLSLLVYCRNMTVPHYGRGRTVSLGKEGSLQQYILHHGQSKNAVDFETRPRPLKSSLELSQDQDHYR